MKIIDLLNKIANGEIDRNNKYQFSRYDYCTIDDFFNRYIVDEEKLNLEILEEKKIPDKWNDLSFTTMRRKEDSIDDDIDKIKGYIETIMRTQNEVLDYLKSKGE